MNGAWRLEDSRLVQYRQVTSAANAENVSFSASPVPEGKIRVVTGFGYSPSVAETEVICVAKTNGTLREMAVLNPVSLALNPASATFIEQGMEYILFPGEYIIVYRGGHTAGSTMTIFIQFIEVDQPLYTYDEPQVVKRQKQALSSIRSMLGGGTGGGGGGGGTSGGTGPRPPGGGGGRPPAP